VTTCDLPGDLTLIAPTCANKNREEAISPSSRLEIAAVLLSSAQASPAARLKAQKALEEHMLDDSSPPASRLLSARLVFQSKMSSAEICRLAEAIMTGSLD
jgi:hypothetical protein